MRILDDEDEDGHKTAAVATGGSVNLKVWTPLHPSNFFILWLRLKSLYNYFIQQF